MALDCWSKLTYVVIVSPLGVEPLSVQVNIVVPRILQVGIVADNVHFVAVVRYRQQFLQLGTAWPTVISQPDIPVFGKVPFEVGIGI